MYAAYLWLAKQAGTAPGEVEPDGPRCSVNSVNAKKHADIGRDALAAVKPTC